MATRMAVFWLCLKWPPGAAFSFWPVGTALPLAHGSRWVPYGLFLDRGSPWETNLRGQSRVFGARRFAAAGVFSSAPSRPPRSRWTVKPAAQGFGFVEMGSDAEAQAAINGMNGQALEGRAIVVNEARPREERGWRRRRWRRQRRWWLAVAAAVVAAVVAAAVAAAVVAAATAVVVAVVAAVGGRGGYGGGGGGRGGYERGSGRRLGADPLALNLASGHWRQGSARGPLSYGPFGAAPALRAGARPAGGRTARWAAGAAAWPPRPSARG